jgi:type 2 lantibiotic biosynthesis protein LanM
MSSLVGGNQFAEVDAIRGWLLQTRPIDAKQWEPNSQNVSFVELWSRIALGAMESLPARLPEQVAGDYQTKQTSWGQFSDLRADLIAALTASLATIGQPALWEEFNKRRTADQVILAHLGQTADARPRRDIYCAFLEELRSDGLEGLLARYPVLRRHLSTAIENWKQSTSEILARVHEDRSLLNEAFGISSGSRLTRIAQGQGDAHRSGRTVSILSFASEPGLGSSIRIVYKPRDVGLDEAFQSLIGQVSPPSSEDHPLQSLSVIKRDGYGYMEFVEHEICTDDQELRSFYRNAGRLSAVLHLLGCSDCHHENLIACKDQLLLVDAETLFEGIPTATIDTIDSPGVRLSKLQREIAASVLKLGILPHWEVIGVDQMPMDASALGIQPPAEANRQVSGWVGLNSDGMFLGSVTQKTPLPTSLPVGFGSPNRLSEFVEDFCDGLQGQLATIADEKWKWTGGGGILARFRFVKRRYVHRATWLYSSVQQRQLEPASLLTETNQRLILESLARKYLSSEARPVDWPLFAAEVAAMNDLDIPLFEQAVDEVGLNTPKIGRIFEKSGYENACKKIKQLNSEQINFQVTLARGAVTAKQIGRDHGIQPSYDRVFANSFTEETSTAEERATEARNIGKAIVSNSITDGHQSVEWLGVHLSRDSESSIYGPLGISLYDGKMGIALFLAALARETGQGGDVYRLAASRACSELKTLMAVQRRNERVEFWRDQPLGLAGSAGVILACLHLRDLVPDLRDIIDEGVSGLVIALDIGRIRADDELDVMKGCAGLIGPLLRIGSPHAQLLAEEAGRHLVDKQHRSGGWLLEKISAKPLTGFSHGASGMAAALARLHAVTNRREYRQSAERALEYERVVFSPDHMNWPDYRGHQVTSGPRFMLSWCHGAPGVALSRICMINTSLWSERTQRELISAAETTSRFLPDGDSICCGRFGRSAILRLAARTCNETAWLKAAIRLEDQGLAIKRANGGYGFSEMLGLFRGASGVGLALLEGSSADALLPSILSAGLCDV